MGSTLHRVYYVGEGEEFEASDDEGKSFKKFIKAKSVDHGGDTLFWAPPGKRAEMRTLAVKHPNLVHVQSKRPMLQKNRSIPIVVGDGPPESYLDLTPAQLAECFKSGNRDGLMLERDFVRKNNTPEKIRERAERMLREAEEMEAQALKELVPEEATEDAPAAAPRRRKGSGRKRQASAAE